MRLFKTFFILLFLLGMEACSQKTELPAAEKNFKLCEVSADAKLNEIRNSVANEFGLEIIEDKNFQNKLDPAIRVLFFRKSGSKPWMILMRTDKMNGMYQVYRQENQDEKDLSRLIAMMKSFSVSADKCLN